MSKIEFGGCMCMCVCVCVCEVCGGDGDQASWGSSKQEGEACVQASEDNVCEDRGGGLGE